MEGLILLVFYKERKYSFRYDTEIKTNVTFKSHLILLGRYKQFTGRMLMLRLKTNWVACDQYLDDEPSNIQ